MKELIFAGKKMKPDVRRLSDLKEVVYDKEFLKNSEDVDLYYMYRDLALSRKDRDAMRAENIRYDITVIPPRMLGVEYTKTLGHYHPIIQAACVSYTELYEVVEGEAHYLLQKRKKEG